MYNRLILNNQLYNAKINHGSIRYIQIDSIPISVEISYSHKEKTNPINAIL